MQSGLEAAAPPLFRSGFFEGEGVGEVAGERCSRLVFHGALRILSAQPVRPNFRIKRLRCDLGVPVYRQRRRVIDLLRRRKFERGGET